MLLRNAQSGSKKWSEDAKSSIKKHRSRWNYDHGRGTAFDDIQLLAIVRRLDPMAQHRRRSERIGEGKSPEVRCKLALAYQCDQPAYEEKDYKCSIAVVLRRTTPEKANVAGSVASRAAGKRPTARMGRGTMSGNWKEGRFLQRDVIEEDTYYTTAEFVMQRWWEKTETLENPRAEMKVREAVLAMSSGSARRDRSPFGTVTGTPHQRCMSSNFTVES